MCNPANFKTITMVAMPDPALTTEFEERVELAALTTELEELAALDFEHHDPTCFCRECLRLAYQLVDLEELSTHDPECFCPGCLTVNRYTCLYPAEEEEEEDEHEESCTCVDCIVDF